jgi:hypothetical protein
MFLIHTLIIIVAIYSISAILAETIFSSEMEKKMPTAVRIGFSYFLSLLYFFGAWVCMSIRQAWALGILILIIYTYGKFGNIFKAFDGGHFKQLLKKHLKLLGVFLILANIFFLPLHWKGQYGPFTEGGGDITTYSDVAKRLDDFNLSAAGFEEGASLQKRIDHIQHMLNVTYTDEYFSRPPEFSNPPNAEYQTNVMAFNFSIHSSIYTPFAQFHFLSGNTNYPAYFAVSAFLYACLITSVFGFFRSFGWLPAVMAALLFIGSHSYVSSIYNHYLPQALSVTILSLFLGAVPHVRLFSITGLKTYMVSISTCWISNYNHFIPILLPLMTLASLYWFYPNTTPVQEDKKNKRSRLRTACIYGGWGTLVTFTLITHVTALKNALQYYNGIMQSFQAESSSNIYQGVPLSVFSERWWTQIFGFLSIQHFYPFVLENKIVQAVIPSGLVAAFMVLATGLALVILSKFKSEHPLSTESNKTDWHIIGIYTALISTVILYTYVSQLSEYHQAKSAQYILPCTYFILLLPLVIFFRSEKSFSTFFRNEKKTSWRYLISSSYIFSLIYFIGVLFIPRFVYLKKLGNQEHRASIMNPSFYAETDRIISQDKNAFVLFEPRNSSDIYFGNQPIAGYRGVPTQHLFLRKYDKSDHGSKGKYVDALPSDFIESRDLPHLWTLSSKDKINWQAERLVFKKSPNLYLTGHVYEKNYGLKYRTNNLSPTFDPNDQGLFSYLRSGTALIFLPPGGPHHIEVKVVHRDETNKVKSDQMADEIGKRAKAGEFPFISTMKQDGPIVTMTFEFEKSSLPRLSLLCRYDAEFWFSARLDGKDIIAK